MGSVSRFAVKNSLTEKCENWTICESPSLTIITRLEHADITASSLSSQRQPKFNFGIPSALKSTARISASSLTRSGRAAATRHCNNRCACPWLGFLISRSMRSYVSSKLSGSSSKMCWTLDGKQCRSTSNWQNAHRNLSHNLTFVNEQMATPLHSIRLLRQCLDNQILVLIPPFPHPPV